MAKYLEKPTPQDFSFHSFRRSAATVAADSGATAAQLTDVFDWKSASMPQKYINTSKNVGSTMARFLDPPVNTVDH